MRQVRRLINDSTSAVRLTTLSELSRAVQAQTVKIDWLVSSLVSYVFTRAKCFINTYSSLTHLYCLMILEYSTITQTRTCTSHPIPFVYTYGHYNQVFGGMY